MKQAFALTVASLCLFAFASSTYAVTGTIWRGPSVTFTKEAFSDFTLPENQDRITDNVWITRGNTQGPYNAAQEPSYNQLFSTAPEDTEWAHGTVDDLPNLTFTTWFEWTGGNTGQGLQITNRPAVVHLISDDIYLNLEFTFWGAGPASGQGGGGFSYVRSTAAPEPSTLLLALLGSLIVGAGRRRR